MGTDTREYDVMAWTAKTGVLEGAFIPIVTKPLKETDLAFNILATSVIGSIAEHVLTGGGLLASNNVLAPLTSKLGVVPVAPGGQLRAQQKVLKLPPELRELQGAYNAPARLAEGIPTIAAAAPPPSKGSYESRVMQGIWAAAPYLHNGAAESLTAVISDVHHRTANGQMPDQLATLRTFVKWADRIEYPDTAPTLVSRAFQEMLSGRRGPVALEMPWDVFTQRARTAAAKPFELFPAPQPDPDRIKAAAALIANSKTPMISEVAKISRRKIVETKSISSPVRHEELRITSEGDAPIVDDRTEAA